MRILANQKTRDKKVSINNSEKKLHLTQKLDECFFEFIKIDFMPSDRLTSHQMY